MAAWSFPAGAEEPATKASAGRPATEQTIQAEETAPAPPAGPPQTVLLDDELPADAEAQGTWIWDEQEKAGGARSHGHPSAPGMQDHGFTWPKPIALSLNGKILQQVWLDPADPPAGIAVRFLRPAGEEAGVYWEGEQEVFAPGEYEELWYYGLLPELGEWTELEILAEDLGLEGEEISGIRFLTHGGRALWDRTAFAEWPALVHAATSSLQVSPSPAPSPLEGEGQGEGAGKPAANFMPGVLEDAPPLASAEQPLEEEISPEPPVVSSNEDSAQPP